MKNIFLIPVAFGLLFLFSACGDNNKLVQGESNLPQASTVANEILVVMDSAKWKGTLGQKIRDVFAKPMPGLPQEEPFFKLRYIRPAYFEGFHRRYPNIIFVATLDDGSVDSKKLRNIFSKESIEKINQNQDLFMFTKTNEYAKGQQVLYLFGKTQENLMSKLNENENYLLNYFRGIERERLSKNLSKSRQKNLNKLLKDKYGFTMDIPRGYEIAVQDNNFIWLRWLDPEIDKSIWVTYKDYTSEKSFEQEEIIRLRNTVAQQYIFGSDSTTYMKTENQVPVQANDINFKGDYAVEARGLWRLNEMIMGGPFISYTIVDEQSRRLYYIEGFVYAPGQDKREAIQELEAILWSFDTKSDKPDKKKSSVEEAVQ